MAKNKKVEDVFALGKVPDWYKCTGCGATNVKLWRDYIHGDPLLCAVCAAKNQKKDISDIDHLGKRSMRDTPQRIDQIGYYVPAVPMSRHPGLYWGYSSVPQEGVVWWQKLSTLKSN